MSRSNVPLALRPILSSAAATAGLAVAMSSLTSAANAQTAAPANDGTPKASGADAITLGPVNVESKAVDDQTTSNMNSATTGSSRLAETVKETPRVINVVPQEVIEQQHANTLEQVLRNVPGITISSGEGKGGQIGDQFRIRGLSASGDIYTDGLKDFGVYTHEVFDTEAVDVVKGPSGESFGVGNSGGVINQVSKQAKLSDFGKVEQSFGSGMTYRTTLDVNKAIDETTAIRINALYHNQDVADRDKATNEREGIAVNFGAGIGTDTTWRMNYSYLKGDGTIDQGVPMAKGTDGVYRPATEYGLSRSTSYIRNLDHDNTENHVATSLFTHDFNSNVSVYNDSRFSLYSRDFAVTSPAAVTLAALNQGAKTTMSYGAGGGVAYKQEGWGLQDVAGVKIDGSLLGLRNKVNAGIDLNYTNDQRQIGTWYGRTANQTIVNPTHYYASGAYLAYPANQHTHSQVTNGGVFASDRVWLFEPISIQAGLRADYFRSAYGTNFAAVSGGEVTNKLLSPSASLIYEPVKNASIYTTFSHSAKPQGTDVASAVNVASATSQTPSGNPFNPEQTDLYEVGAKADFLDGRLGLNGAVYRLDKSNSYYIDSSTGTVTDGFSEAGLGLRIKGMELGVSGKVTPAWTVYANYGFMVGTVTKSLSSPASVGNVAPNIPKNSFNVWTTYDVLDHLSTGLPGKITLGGGAQYSSEYWADSANTAMIPYTFSLDSMISYEDDRVSVSLNAYNLTDHLNYSSSFSTSRAVPTSGRTFMGTVAYKF